MCMSSVIVSRGITEVTARDIFAQIFSAVNYMKENGCSASQLTAHDVVMEHTAPVCNALSPVICRGLALV